MLKKQHFLPSTHPNNCQTKDNIYKPQFLIPVSYGSDSHLETVLPRRGHVAISGDNGWFSRRGRPRALLAGGGESQGSPS